MHVNVLGVTVPWLAGFPAPVAGLADAGGLFIAGLPSSWMIGWAGGKLLCSRVDSSPGKLLGEVASFSAEVLSLEWSKLGWGEKRDMDFWPCCIHPRAGPLGFNQCAFLGATSTLLGMRGCCPSCPRTLGLSSGLFSPGSSSLGLPASSGKTRESVDSEASQSSFLNFKVEKIIFFAILLQKLQLKSVQNSFSRRELTSPQMGCRSRHSMPTFLHFLPFFSANLQIWILNIRWPLNSLLLLLLYPRRFGSFQSPDLRLNNGLVCEKVPVFQPGCLRDNGN